MQCIISYTGLLGERALTKSYETFSNLKGVFERKFSKSEP